MPNFAVKVKIVSTFASKMPYIITNEMFLRKEIYALCLIILLTTFSSCLSDNDSDEESATMDAQLLRVTLSHDSVPNLVKVFFSIDQKRSLIYNRDSMAFGTKIRENVVIKYTSASGLSALQNITDGDSTWIYQSDSIDVSRPLLLKSYATDGTTAKTYLFELNIHQVDPDSMQYQKLASDLSFLKNKNATVFFKDLFYAFSSENGIIRLYTSTNAENWAFESETNMPENAVLDNLFENETLLCVHTEDGDLYTSSDGIIWKKRDVEHRIVSLLGFLRPGEIQESRWCAIVEKDEQTLFASTSDFLQWNYGTEIPDEFPLSGFSAISYELVKLQRALIVGGVTLSGQPVNAVWSTQDGLYWAKISDDRFDSLPEVTGANVFYYNDLIYLINGQLADGTYNRKIYYSGNNGYTWQEGAAKCLTPANYSHRANASVALSPDKRYFYIIGGNQNTHIADIWKGSINKMLFDH